MSNPSHVIGTPDGDLYAYDWTVGEWVALDVATGPLDGGQPDSTYDGNLDGGQPDTEF